MEHRNNQKNKGSNLTLTFRKRIKIKRCLHEISFGAKNFLFGVWSISYNYLHDTTQNETHCECHFIAVILTKMKFHFGL